MSTDETVRLKSQQVFRGKYETWEALILNHAPQIALILLKTLLEHPGCPQAHRYLALKMASVTFTINHKVVSAGLEEAYCTQC